MKYLGEKTIHTYEISDLDRLILMGLISKVLSNATIDLDAEATVKLNEILTGLANTK